MKSAKKNFQKEIDKSKFLNSDEIVYLKNIQLSENEFEITIFQQKLHNLLLEYLSTPYLLSNKFSRVFSELVPFFSKKKIIYESNDIKIKDLPQVIKRGYEILENLIFLNKKKLKTEKIKVNKVDIKTINHSKIVNQFINFSKNKLTPFISFCCIHGSCANNEVTEFSDLDTFMIIKKETIFDVFELCSFKIQWLKSLKHLYLFDALQHHDHLFCTEVDLSFYPYNWLPPLVFKDSVCITEKNEFHLKLIDNEYYRVINFFNLIQRFRDKNILNKRYNEYTFKNDLSVIYLFPALFLQSIGFDISKKESFDHDLIQKMGFSSFFNKISKIRLSWRTSKISKLVLSKRYSFFVRMYYLRFFIRPLHNNSLLRNGKMKESFLNDINDVLNKMSHKIINNKTS